MQSLSYLYIDRNGTEGLEGFDFVFIYVLLTDQKYEKSPRVTLGNP